MPLIVKEITIVIPVIQTDKELHPTDLITETLTLSVEDFCNKILEMDKDKCMEKIVNIIYGMAEENEEGEE